MLHLVIEPACYGGHFNVVLTDTAPQVGFPLVGIRVAMCHCEIRIGQFCAETIDMLRQGGASVTLHKLEGE